LDKVLVDSYGSFRVVRLVDEEMVSLFVLP